MKIEGRHCASVTVAVTTNKQHQNYTNLPVQFKCHWILTPSLPHLFNFIFGIDAVESTEESVNLSHTELKFYKCCIKLWPKKFPLLMSKQITAAKPNITQTS